MVEKYNAHIRGVDLCYMLLALYRIRLRTCKYYMHMVYYCMGISITNGWLLYQRYFEQKHGSKKRPKWICVNFNRTLQMLFWETRKRIPLSEAALHHHHHPPPMVLLPAKGVTLQHFLSLLKISDLIVMGTFPVFTKKQNRCRFSPRGYSHIRCRK